MAKPSTSKKTKPNGKPGKPAPPRANGAAKAKSQPNARNEKNGKKNGGDGAAKADLKVKKSAKVSSAPPEKAAKPPKAEEKKPRQQSELETRLVHMIAEEMAIEEAELTPDASFKEDLNLDEIDIAELLMQAESQFSVHPFSEADWESSTTVGAFVALVSKRVDAKRGRKAGRA